MGDSLTLNLKMLNDLISCDLCLEEFTLTNKPLTLPKCGHVICTRCEKECENRCPVTDCGSEYDTAIVNQKVMNFIQKVQKTPGLAQSMTPSSSKYL